MNVDFNITTEIRNNALVIKTDGYINNTAGERIAKEFNNQFNEGISRVVLDLEKSKVINSIGISYLLEIIEKLNDSNCKLIFTNLDPTVEKTFNIMGLFQFAEKADSIDSAIK